MNTSPEQPVRQSVWQYSLRGLFLATLAVAILSAFVAPLLRAAEPKQRLAFVWIVVETALGAFLCAAVLIRRRSRLEKRFGTLLLSLAHRSLPRKWIGIALAISQFVMPIWLTVSSVHLVFQSKEPSLIVWLNPAPLMNGALLSYTFFTFWWRGPFGPIEFCEQGILFGQWGIAWSEIKEYRVFSDSRIRLRKRFGTSDFHVPSECLADTDALLRRFVPRSAVSALPAVFGETNLLDADV
jgi:hypothetical protein